MQKTSRHRWKEAMTRRWAHVVVDLPELNMGTFAFLLSFPWEILQSPFFQGMTEARHWDAVRICMLATLGDVGLMLINFWIVAWVGGGRRWPLEPTVARVAGFTGLGLAVQRSHADDPYSGGWPYPAADVGCAVAPHPLVCSPAAQGRGRWHDSEVRKNEDDIRAEQSVQAREMVYPKTPSVI